MPKLSMDEEQANRNRTLLISSGIMATVATALLAHFFIGIYGMPFGPSPAQAQGKVGYSYVRSTPKMYKSAVDKAEKLRNEWRGWAENHRRELGAMQSGDKSEATFLHVFDALPAITNGGKSGIRQETIRGGDVPFGWSPMMWGSLPVTFLNESDKAHWEKGIREAKEQSHREFSKYGDMQITQSANPGAWQIVLWASGRVTENEMVTSHENGLFQTEDVIKKTLFPPFALPTRER